MKTETKRMRELLLTARAILNSRPLDHTTCGVCGVLHEAKTRHGIAYTTAYSRIQEHVLRSMDGVTWMWHWLRANGHISEREFLFFARPCRGWVISDAAEERRLHERLRATRLAWIDHMINKLDTKGTL